VPGTNGVLVVMAHGSPGTALGMLPVGRGLARRGYGVLLLNLPSYAGSEGPRTWGASFREAVRAGVDFAAAQRDVRAIAAYGYSMSTAIVLQVAADDARIRALVLLAPFTDIRAQRAHQHRSRVPGVAAMAIPTARWLGLAVDELDATQAARRIGDRPVLLIVGEQDPAIPLWMPSRLKELAANAEIWVIPGAGHVGVARDAGDAYFDRIDEFLRVHLRVETTPSVGAK
jgi:pimeloyl-ACP methyl ester carboxylesterase